VSPTIGNLQRALSSLEFEMLWLLHRGSRAGFNTKSVRLSRSRRRGCLLRSCLFDYNLFRTASFCVHPFSPCHRRLLSPPAALVPNSASRWLRPPRFSWADGYRGSACRSRSSLPWIWRWRPSSRSSFIGHGLFL
jgi:hypothetical protein